MTRNDQIETLCIFLGAGEFSLKGWRQKGYDKPPATLEDFDRIEPVWRAGDVQSDPVLARSSWRIDLPVSHGMDASWAVRNIEAPGAVFLQRMRVLSPREIRGRVMFERFVIAMWMAQIDPDGIIRDSASGLYLFSRNGRDWRRADGSRIPRFNLSMPTLDELHRCGDYRAFDDVGLAGQIALFPGTIWRRERVWSVALGFEGRPRVHVETSSTGIREMFALRDVPPGKKRRSALRHWVSAHWRSRGDRRDDIWVREHLRGAESFTWNGMRGQVHVPSREAEEELAEFEAQTAPSMEVE